MEEEYKTKQDTNFNIDIATFQLIADLENQAIRFGIMKRYNKAFDNWVAVRTLLEPCFDDDESNELRELELKYKQPIRFNVPAELKTTKQMGELSPRQAFIKSRFDIIQPIRLNNYSRKILRLMKKYRIILIDKETKTQVN